MFCPECKDKNLKSEVREKFANSIPSVHIIQERYWDADGNQHIHGKPAEQHYYRCSNGHNWNTKEEFPCPGCTEIYTK